jgi:hypothetical protein
MTGDASCRLDEDEKGMEIIHTCTDSQSSAGGIDFIGESRLTFGLLTTFGESVVDRHHGLGHQGDRGHTFGTSSPKLAKSPHCLKQPRPHSC